MTSTTLQRSIRLTPTGEVTETGIEPGGDGIRAAIGCDRFDVISLDHAIDLWVDDEGLLVAEPQLNLPATLVAHALGVQTAVFGTAIALSVDPTTGDSTGLSDAQARRVQHALSKPRQEVTAAVARTLSCLIRPRR